MNGITFDYDDYLKKCEERNARAAGFSRGEFLPVTQWTLGKKAYGANCRYRENMLLEQLEGITETLRIDNDYIPFLQPWHGVGVFAQAFGCPFIWGENDIPWTKPVVNNLEELKRLTKPKISNSRMLQYVLDTTEYFNEATGGRVMISPTDMQSPLGTLSLVCDVTWVLTEMMDYLEEFHRVLNDITELMIEFGKKQRELCTRPALPGHTMWSSDCVSGICVNDDILALVGSDFYKEFGVPYNEKIGMAFGGIGVHSCGQWSHNFESVKKIKSMTMVDMALSKIFDPAPVPAEKIIVGFEGTDIPVQVRCDPNDTESIDFLLSSDVRVILNLWWNDDPAERARIYTNIKRRWEELRKAR